MQLRQLRIANIGDKFVGSHEYTNQEEPNIDTGARNKLVKFRAAYICQ